MTMPEFLARQLNDTREWTLKLLADIAGDDWGFQPGAGLAHPLWICGHVASSQSLLVIERCLGKPPIVPAEFSRNFPIGGPVKGLKEHGYPPADIVLQMMKDTHARTCEAIRSMSDSQLAEPAFGANGSIHPHYKDKAGAIAHCARHEAFHAGQLALIRRLLGRSFLR